MLQVPNTDLLTAMSRLTDPASPSGQIAAHHRAHIAALREQRRTRLAGLWQRALSLLHPRHAHRKPINET